MLGLILENPLYKEMKFCTPLNQYFKELMQR